MPSYCQRWTNALTAALQQRQSQHLLRQLRPIDSPQGPTLELLGRQLVQFCSNNYLGLANDPEVIAAAHEALDRYGFGAGASRLVAGSMSLHHQLEEALAAFKQTPAALVFPSGYSANLALLTTLAGPGDRIVSDKLNHASLLDAAGVSGADHRTFPHRHTQRAGELLAKPWHTPTPGWQFLVSDSVFSMDGDIADLTGLAQLAKNQDALLILDEAHGTGVLGETGRGAAELLGCEDDVSASVGTLSKALGSIGGFVTGPKALIETLINEARTFIYTTALPPICSAAALAALRIVQREPQRRKRVLALAEQVRQNLTALGLNCGASQSPIIPVILGDAQKALAASEQLREAGYFVPAIRPPSVPPGTSRLRISLMSSHTDSQVEGLLETISSLVKQGKL